MYYFTVLTYPGGITDEIQNALLQFCANKFTTYIIVLEYGKSKQNPHLNIVYEISDDLQQHWSSNANKYFKKCYAFHDLSFDQTRLIKTKRCSSPANVIGGYLQKEDLMKVLINKGFDIEHLKDLAKINLKPVKLSIKNIHVYIHDNILYFDKPNTLAQFTDIISENLCFHPDVIPFLPKIKFIWAIYDTIYLQGNLNNHSL